LRGKEKNFKIQTSEKSQNPNFNGEICAEVAEGLARTRADQGFQNGGIMDFASAQAGESGRGGGPDLIIINARIRTLEPAAQSRAPVPTALAVNTNVSVSTKVLKRQPSILTGHPLGRTVKGQNVFVLNFF
jgi:hypothetical protein